MKKIIFLITCIVLLQLSCTERYDIEIDPENEVLVVDGILTNQDTDHYIRLSKSRNSLVNADFSGFNHSATNFNEIKDANITISDDAGNSEKLSYIGFIEGQSPEIRGYYRIKEIRGVVGRTYTLKIQWAGKEYKSVSILKPVPEIEKITFKEKHLEAKNETVTIPLISFTEPQNTKDFYLLHYSVDAFSGSNRKWQYSIINDEFLSEHINKMEIDDGQSSSGRDFYNKITRGNKVVVYLESLTEEAYNYYRGIIKQFNSDGGAFSQTPANPPGNISNGALGFFRCSAVATKSITKD